MSNVACCDRVRPENSARYFPNPAPILIKPRTRQLLAAHTGARVLDLGGGCLRNALFLQRQGFRVSVLEVGAMEARFPDQYKAFRQEGGRVFETFPRARFEIAISTFVLETICRPQIRARLLASTLDALTSRGFFLLSVRGPRDLVTASAKGKRCSDGFITPGLTFARAYTLIQLRPALEEVGFGEIEFLHKIGVNAPELLHAIAWKGRSQ